MTNFTFHGLPCCECLAIWLPAYERELIARKVIAHSLDVFQLIGDAPDSAGVHREGGAFDTGQTQDEAIWVARQMGADATWPRLWPGNIHTHGVLRGCPHNGPARYQITAVAMGFDGTGTNGRGGRDPVGPDGKRRWPLSRRTWQQGIAWQATQDDRRARAAKRSRLTKTIRALRARIARLRARRKELRS